MAEKKIFDYLPKTEILGQLTEELAEASAAASKLRRKIDGKNPTPKTLEERWEDLKKEIGDVINSIDALTEQDPQNYHEFMSECGEYAEPKMERWLSRLQAQKNPTKIKKECCEGVFDVNIHCENEQEMDEAVKLLNLANRMHWRKTAENPPKKEDASEDGHVIAVAAPITRMCVGYPSEWLWSVVAKHPYAYPLWMPMPELPEGIQNRCRNRKRYMGANGGADR